MGDVREEELNRLAERLDHLDGHDGEERDEIESIMSDLRALSARAAVPDGQSEPIAWRATTPAFRRFVTESTYQRFSPDVRKWYEPYRCANCAAPQPAGKRTVPNMSKSWPERDYMCVCSQCGETFIGWKRQAVCRGCTPPEPAPSAPGDAFSLHGAAGRSASRETADVEALQDGERFAFLVSRWHKGTGIPRPSTPADEAILNALITGDMPAIRLVIDHARRLYGAQQAGDGKGGAA